MFVIEIVADICGVPASRANGSSVKPPCPTFLAVGTAASVSAMCFVLITGADGGGLGVSAASCWWVVSAHGAAGGVLWDVVLSSAIVVEVVSSAVGDTWWETGGVPSTSPCRR